MSLLPIHLFKPLGDGSLLQRTIMQVQRAVVEAKGEQDAADQQQAGGTNEVIPHRTVQAPHAKPKSDDVQRFDVLDVFLPPLRKQAPKVRPPAVHAVKAAAIAASDPLAQGLSSSQIPQEWEIESKAINDVDFKALGELTTSPLFKAPFIAVWLDTAGNALTTTAVQGFGKSIWLIYTGLTPIAARGAGILGAVFNAINGVSNEASSGASNGATKSPSNGLK